MADEIQDTLHHKDQSSDWWCLAHTLMSAPAWGHCNRFSWPPYATQDWQWIWHANNIYGITTFMLYGLYWSKPVFLEVNFLILELKVSFGLVQYPTSVLIYKNRPLRSRHMTPRLSCQWSVAQQRDSHLRYSVPSHYLKPIRTFCELECK